MNKQKIAVVVDSCCDVPKTYVDRYGIYVIPLKILYRDAEYLDGVDITSEKVYENLTKEIPKTSLPSADFILALFAQIKADGYERVIVVTLSSGLSGTNNMLNLLTKEYQGLSIYVLDTKNISIGAGFHAIQAARYVAQGMAFEDIIYRLERNLCHTKLFFVVETLEYLQKGGRIGKVAALLGSALNLKPIISCDEEGIYYTVAKVRGRKQSIRKTIELALAYADSNKCYNVGIIHGNSPKLSKIVKDAILPKLSNMDLFVEKQCSPALGVHTGPGTLGIGIQLLEGEKPSTTF